MIDKKKINKIRIDGFATYFLDNPEKTYDEFLSYYNNYHSERPDFYMIKDELKALIKKLSRYKILEVKQNQRTNGTFFYIKNINQNKLEKYSWIYDKN